MYPGPFFSSYRLREGGKKEEGEEEKKEKKEKKERKEKKRKGKRKKGPRLSLNDSYTRFSIYRYSDRQRRGEF